MKLEIDLEDFGGWIFRLVGATGAVEPYALGLYRFVEVTCTVTGSVYVIQ